MHIEEYRNYCLSKKGVTEETPFPKLQNVLVFKVLGKMFTATDINTFASFSIKCNPDTIEELRAEYPSLQIPSYFSKKHWNNVIMNGEIQDKLLREWLDVSYNLVVKNFTKKLKSKLENI
jgi:predicted DNA-binding protein (MmcQ/YjbR family)